MDRFEARFWDNGDDRVAQPPADPVRKILAISPDPATLDQIARVLNQQCEWQLTCVSDAAFARDSAVGESHDLMILDAEGITNVSATFSAEAKLAPAFICLCDQKRLPECVTALTGTGYEIVVKPLSPEVLWQAVEVTLRRNEHVLQLAVKYRKMRQLVRRVVRERRDINRRVELVCRDLVEAHRRLTYRFVELQKSQSS